MSATRTDMTSAPTTVTNQTRSIVVGGLAVGAALGFTGNVLSGTAQSVVWAISAVALIVAAVALAVQLGASRPLAATGFLLFALGETRVLNPTDLPTGEASFAAGAFLYAPGLLVLALATWAPVWVRVVGALSGTAFGAHALLFFGGAAVDSTGPLATIGYTLLTVTIVGWILTVLRQPVPDTRRGA